MANRRGMANGKAWEWPLNRDNTALLSEDQGTFEAELEIPQFRPEEVEVQVNENDLTIHCLQERAGTPLEVLRTYKLPEDIDPATVQMAMEEDGTLRVSASKRRHY